MFSTVSVTLYLAWVGLTGVFPYLQTSTMLEGLPSSWDSSYHMNRVFPLGSYTYDVEASTADVNVNPRDTLSVFCPGVEPTLVEKGTRGGRTWRVECAEQTEVFLAVGDSLFRRGGEPSAQLSGTVSAATPWVVAWGIPIVFGAYAMFMIALEPEEEEGEG